VKKETFFCDICGVELEPRRESSVGHPNVDVHYEKFRVTIQISREGICTELCRKCRIEIVSDAILETDRFHCAEVVSKGQIEDERREM